MQKTKYRKTLKSKRLKLFAQRCKKLANYSVEKQRKEHSYGSRNIHSMHANWKALKRLNANEEGLILRKHVFTGLVRMSGNVRKIHNAHVKLSPMPQNPIYNKQKTKVDHTNMVFIKSKNVWKKKEDVTKPAKTGSVLYTQVINQTTKAPEKLSPKEKRKAWRRSHIPNNWNGPTADKFRKAASA